MSWGSFLEVERCYIEKIGTIKRKQFSQGKQSTRKKSVRGAGPCGVM